MVDGLLKTIKVPNDSYFNAINVQDGDSIYIREYPYRKLKFQVLFSNQDHTQWLQVKQLTI